MHWSFGKRGGVFFIRERKSDPGSFPKRTKTSPEREGLGAAYIGIRVVKVLRSVYVSLSELHFSFDSEKWTAGGFASEGA